MDKKLIMVISVIVAIGLVAGGFAGYGITYSLNPETPAPRTYTLTICNYKIPSGNASWTPSNVGSNFTTSEEIVTIIFEENTNVTLVANGDYWAAWQGPDAADVHWVTDQLAWIVMDSNKVIQVNWL
jgi:hypothetical protein